MSTASPAEPRYVVCVRNDGYPASLEPRKLYEVLPDQGAAALGQLRVIDESGEDYLYPAGYFAEVQLPQAVQQALRRAS
jgi:hypothetical protein